MKPFVIFRAPNSIKWNYKPSGKRIYRARFWVKLPFTNTAEVNEIITKQPIAMTDLKPFLDENANELMDTLQCALYAHWAQFLLKIDDATTDEEIDEFFDNFPQSDYGFECYVWR